MQYEALKPPRYLVEDTGSGETIRIKATRPVFPLLFLPVWLAAWTVGGIAAITQFLQHFEPFLLFWLCGWALGWVFAAGSIGWMLFGSEMLRVVGRDLELGFQIAIWSRRKIYEGSQVRSLRACTQSNPMLSAFRFSVPFFGGARYGSIQFNYGARTLYAASGLDEAEAQSIVGRLLRRLPSTASDDFTE